MSKLTIKSLTTPRSIFVAFAAFTVIACSGIQDEQVTPEARTHDGLLIVESDRTTQIQLKQNVDWDNYDKAVIAQSHVAFKTNWERDYNREHRASRVRQDDMDTIRARVGEIVHRSVTDKFSEVPGMTVTTQADANTLLIKPNVINLDVNAPDLNSSGVNRTYARSAGSLTMYLEIYDATSGEILARWIEDLRDREDMYLSWTNRVTNTAAAKRVIDRWANEFVSGFNALRAQQPIASSTD